MSRYKHWFWNSKLVSKFAQQLSYLNSWLWHKQFNRDKAKRTKK